MSGSPRLGTSTRPHKTGSGVAPAGKEPTKRQTIKEARIKASDAIPTPKKPDEKKHGTSARSGKRMKSLRRQRSTSSPTLAVNEVSPPQTPTKSFRRINLELLSLESPKPDLKPARNGAPPRPWDLKSPRDLAQGRGGLGVSTPEWIVKLTLDELATESESLQTRVSDLNALYSQWRQWYDTLPKCHSTHADVVAEHQKLKGSTAAGGWALHDALEDAKALQHSIAGRIEKLEKG